MTKRKEQNIISILDNVINKFYWLDVLIKLNEITEAEAGFIIYKYYSE